MRHGQGTDGRAASAGLRGAAQARRAASGSGSELVGERPGPATPGLRRRASLTPVVLTIAGSDSSAGAGLQADLKTLQLCGVYGASAVTLITAQNTQELRRIEVLDASLVTAQIDAVADDLDVAVVKLGALGSAANVDAVLAALTRHGWDRVVVDPVRLSSSGDGLLDEEGFRALRDRLVPRATVITPNLAEAGALTGEAVHTPRDMERAARQLVARGAGAALVTGGHLPGAELVDVLCDGAGILHLAHPRRDTRHTHGTGCTLASAVAGGLARGQDVREAVTAAVALVQRALAAAPGVGHGAGPLGHRLDPE